MIPVLAILAAFIPAGLWLWFFYSRDRYEREPKSLIVKLFFWGLLAGPWAAGLNDLLRGILGPSIQRAGEAGAIPFAVTLLVAMVALAALNEETMKYLVTTNSTRADPRFNEPVDGMIYISAAALGFAGGENFFYVIRAYVGGLENAPAGAAFAFAFGNVAVFRALFTTVGHVAWSGIVGYFLGQHLVGKRPGRFVLLGILGAAALHSLWNLSWWFQGIFAANARSFWFIDFTRYFALAMVVVGFSAALYLLLLRKALSASPFRATQLAAGEPAPAKGSTPAG